MKNNKIKVAVVQQAGYAEYEKNLQASERGIQEAATKGAKLILLQELHTGFYFCQVEDARLFEKAETIPGPTTERLSALAAQLNVVIVASLFEKRAPGLYHNTAVVLEKDGTLAGIYRKMHIPDDPGFYEKFYFAPGDLGFTPITTSIAKLGILVCWDQWYPEGARLMALSGAEILLYPTAIGWGTLDADPDERQRQQQAWLTIQRAHAIANGLPIMVANRIGVEVNPENSALGIKFWGSSFIAGPQGEILSEGSTDREAVVMAEIDKARIEKVRCGWPFFRDRRIDAYGDIVKRYIDKK